ncbi:sulfatase-like hydrolase/transferase [Marinicrinis sediminis]|uniref:Sulfatase-like hydrolase/transferase n=1 Tax=Marinicrinis sediminis TaxID=1652465 RepID=A0ABW5RET1_9BACL
MSRVKPNLVLVLTDDQGYGDLGLHGNADLETPRLDELGRASIRMDAFHCTPVCAPTRASLLTGRDFLRTGVWHVHGGRDFLNPEETTMAQMLKDQGYRTGMMGKWHSGKTHAYLPYHRGFEEAWMATLYEHQHNEMDHNGERVQTEGWTTEVITDLAIDFIHTHQAEPFFLYVPYLAPHEPWYAPERYIDKYRQKGLSDSLSTVYGMIEQVDENVGRIRDALEEAGLLEDTIFLFLSDNGPIAAASNMPDLTDEEMSLRNPPRSRGNKGTIWDHGTHVPCLISWPGRLKPRVEAEMAHVTDLVPTLLDFMGVPLPQGNLPLDGQSLRALLEKQETLGERLFYNATHETAWTGKTHEWDVLKDRNHIRFDLQDCNLSVRNHRYKFVPGTEGDGLYDTVADPRERHNLAQEHPEMCSFMREKLASWYQELLASGRSHQIAVFFIGYPGETETTIPTYAPIAVTGHVTPGSHGTHHWLEPGDSQQMAVEVMETAWYEIGVRAEVCKPGTSMAVSIGTQSWITELNEEWTSLGSFPLSEGRDVLSMELVNVPPGPGEAVRFRYPLDGLVVRRVTPDQDRLNTAAKLPASPD